MSDVKDTGILITPESCGADERDAMAVGLLTETGMEFAYRLCRRAHHTGDAKAHCSVLLDDRQDILGQLADKDYAAIAAAFESRYDQDFPASNQMQQAAQEYLQEKFRLWGQYDSEDDSKEGA